MPHPTDKSSPMGLYALLASLLPFFSALSMLLLKLGVGPEQLLYQVANLTGTLLFGLLVIASALSLVALARSGRREWRALLALGLQALTLLIFLVFVQMS